MKFVDDDDDDDDDTVVLWGCSFYDAMNSQPRWTLIQQNSILWTGHCLVLFGTMLVATSYWALGFYATFLGILFDHLFH